MIAHIFKLLWNKKGSNALMVLEIFLSFLVLFFVLSYVLYNLNITNAPLGFETEDKWMIGLDNVDNLDSVEAVLVIQNLKQNLLAEEEIKGVSFTPSMAPFHNSQWRNGTDKNGFPMMALVVNADLDFVDVLGIKILKGRNFQEDDLNANETRVLVNQEFLDEYYPEKNMIDSTFLFDSPRKIVGVIEDYRYIGEFEKKTPTVIFLKEYTELNDFVVLDMKEGTPTAYEEKLSLLVNNSTKKTGNIIMDLEKERKDDSRESWLLVIALLSICGFLCINVALGLFGILWYNINKRRSEIGLRQAVGAHGFDISKQFILEIIFLTSIALFIGIFFAVQIPLLDVTEYPDSMFYKAIIYSCMIILGLVSACALFPSIQAARISPSNSLHEN